MSQHSAPQLSSEQPMIAGKYRLVTKLGQGGMAEVWEAINTDLDVAVALKLCRPEVAQTPELASRLLREAKAVARLTHPNIVRVFDAGLTAEGAPFIVMERLRGKSLRSQMSEWSQVDEPFLVRTMMAVGEALDHAHHYGLVHRDVKPDNIFLSETSDGKLQAKLLDFGIVKLRDYDVHLTQTGMTLGSPAYMAPEQAGGEPDVDGRADLWGASVVLFEALVGHLPFEADNYNALLRMILMDTAPDVWQELRVQRIAITPLTDALAHVITRGLKKPRQERWQNAREFVEALERTLPLVPAGEEQRFSLPELGVDMGGKRELPSPATRNVPVKLIWALVAMVSGLFIVGAVALFNFASKETVMSAATSNLPLVATSPSSIPHEARVTTVGVPPTTPPVVAAPSSSVQASSKPQVDGHSLADKRKYPRKLAVANSKERARDVTSAGEADLGATTPTKPAASQPQEGFKQPY